MDFRELNRLAKVGRQAVRKSITELAKTRDEQVSEFLTKADWDPARHVLWSITAPHAFAKPLEAYREVVIIIPKRDEALYQGRTVDPKLMDELTHRYPSVQIVAHPVLMTKILTK